MPVTGTEEALWREYRSRLFGFVRKRVADETTAEDIVHDVLMRALEKRDTLRSADRFEQWLYQITRNALIDHYRARRPTETLPTELADEDEQTSRQAMRELATCIQPLVDTLPPRYRDAPALAELEGLTQQETAGRLGLSLSCAKSRVQRGRRMLEDKLLDCCRIELDVRGRVVDFERANGCATDPGTGCGRC